MNKIKNWIIGILFVIISVIGIAYFSADNANASSTNVNAAPIHYETVTIRGCTVAVFRYKDDIEVVKL